MMEHNPEDVTKIGFVQYPTKCGLLRSDLLWENEEEGGPTGNNMC